MQHFNFTLKFMNSKKEPILSIVYLKILIYFSFMKQLGSSEMYDIRKTIKIIAYLIAEKSHKYFFNG